MQASSFSDVSLLPATLQAEQNASPTSSFSVAQDTKQDLLNSRHSLPTSTETLMNHSVDRVPSPVVLRQLRSRSLLLEDDFEESRYSTLPAELCSYLGLENTTSLSEAPTMTWRTPIPSPVGSSPNRPRSSSAPELSLITQLGDASETFSICTPIGSPDLKSRRLRAPSTGAAWAPMTITFQGISYVVPVKQRWTAHLRSLFQSKELKTENMDPDGVEAKPVVLKKTVLHDFTGCIQPGELVAIMGPTGSGKSSFLDLLAHRLLPNRVSGSIKVNGIDVNKEISRKCFGYVWQDDALHENLTVRETLMYVAKLRYKVNDSQTLNAKVQSLLEELGLQSCADTRVGGISFRGISGGERKRLSIAIELVGNPSVLFLDEPTTGLDSCNAYYIVKTLKALSHRQRTVVCTIHQPQSSIYALFDKILLMGRGGHVIYFGEGGEKAVEYFRELGYDCDSNTNPSDHFLDIINSFPQRKRKSKRFSKSHRGNAQESILPIASSPTSPRDLTKIDPEAMARCDDFRVEKFVKAYRESKLCRRNVKEVEFLLNIFTQKSDRVVDRYSYQTVGSARYSQGLKPEDDNEIMMNVKEFLESFPPSIGEQTVPSKTSSLQSRIFSSSDLKRGSSWMFSRPSRIYSYNDLINNSAHIKAPSYFSQFCTLLARSFKDYHRNNVAFVFRLAQTVLIGLFIGLTYYQVGEKTDQKSVSDRKGVLFFLAIQQAMSGFLTVVTLFHGWERVVFQREYASSLYDSHVYFLSKLFSELPLQIVSPVIFGCITFFMVGLNFEAVRFVIFIVCLIITTLTGQALGLAVSVFSPSLDIANVISPMLLGMILLCGGLLINVDNIPIWFRWTSWVDFVRYGYQILAINDLTGLTFDCPVSVLPVLPVTTPDQVAALPSNVSTTYQMPKPGIGTFFRRIFNPKSLMPSPAAMKAAAEAQMQSVCLFPTGEDVIKSLSFDNLSLGICFAILASMFLGLLILSYIGLKICVATKYRK